MHLLYARMWTKVMFDEELIGFDEPFPALRNQGVVWASDGQRMSKSKGNVVTPDAMIDKYGADALRLWELFMIALRRSDQLERERRRRHCCDSSRACG